MSKRIIAPGPGKETWWLALFFVIGTIIHNIAPGWDIVYLFLGLFGVIVWIIVRTIRRYLCRTDTDTKE